METPPSGSVESPPSSKAGRFFRRVLQEIGILSVYQSSWDTKLLCLQRFVRMFAYGGSTLVLASFLSGLHISEAHIGLFMTATLIGDVVISFFLTLYGDIMGRKVVLALGSVLMTISGVIFALGSNFWLLLIAAIVGVISPSGNEIGPFRAIEESTLAHLTVATARNDVYAWYSLFGIAGAAFGLMTCGWVIDVLQSSHDFSPMQSYRMVFFAYAAVGIVKFSLACALSSKVEAEKQEPRASGSTETDPLLQNGAPQTKKPRPKITLFPKISRESLSIFWKLAILFGLDSFASGLAAQSWIVYFFKTKFHLAEGKLGSIFFTTSIISALSTLVAAAIARRIGNIKTMVFTHLPSGIALALIGIPSSLPFALLFIILRSCTQQMDAAPRTAFLAAIILPTERTAIMGTLNVIKTSTAALGPLTTGLLANAGEFWIAFVMAGSLKVTYDLGMLVTFLGHKSRDEQTAEPRVPESEREEDSDDEEHR